jgi:hypothetical protein
VFVPQVQPHSRHCHLPAEAAEGRPRQEALQENGCSKVLPCRGIMVYMEYKSVCPFVGIRFPLPPASVSPPGTQRSEEQHSLAGEGLEDPIPTTGKKAWHSVLQFCERYFSTSQALQVEFLRSYEGGPRQLIKTGIKPFLSHVLLPIKEY